MSMLWLWVHLQSQSKTPSRQSCFYKHSLNLGATTSVTSHQLCRDKAFQSPQAGIVSPNPPHNQKFATITPFYRQETEDRDVTCLNHTANGRHGQAWIQVPRAPGGHSHYGGLTASQPGDVTSSHSDGAPGNQRFPWLTLMPCLVNVHKINI